MLTLSGRKWQNLTEIIFCQEILTGESPFLIKAGFLQACSFFYNLKPIAKHFSDDAIVLPRKTPPDLYRLCKT